MNEHDCVENITSQTRETGKLTKDKKKKKIGKQNRTKNPVPARLHRRCPPSVLRSFLRFSSMKCSPRFCFSIARLENPCRVNTTRSAEPQGGLALPSVFLGCIPAGVLLRAMNQSGNHTQASSLPVPAAQVASFFVYQPRLFLPLPELRLPLTSPPLPSSLFPSPTLVSPPDFPPPSAPPTSLFSSPPPRSAFSPSQSLFLFPFLPLFGNLLRKPGVPPPFANVLQNSVGHCRTGKRNEKKKKKKKKKESSSPPLCLVHELHFPERGGTVLCGLLSGAPVPLQTGSCPCSPLGAFPPRLPCAEKTPLNQIMPETPAPPPPPPPLPKAQSKNTRPPLRAKKIWCAPPPIPNSAF